jgi:hypothetical protein
VSHQPQRKEKNCLNCGSVVVGRYCHVCGQENIDTKETFWSLTRHFIYDIFHFDGKFFHTLGYLFARPGLVAKEYCNGKRTSFLHPIRMYLFTSALFFLVFFSINSVSNGRKHPAGKLNKEERSQTLSEYRARLKESPKDTTVQKVISLLSDTSKEVTGDELLALDSRDIFTISGYEYSNVQQYDSAQQNSVPAKRDTRLKKMLVRKAIAFNQKYKEQPEEASKVFWESFVHRLPYMLFLSLPFFALILQVLYRRRKTLFYSDHAVFTIYHYILSFIFLLLFFLLSRINQGVGWKPLSFLPLLIFIVWPIYLWLEMRSFYVQGWLKTTLKFALVNIFGLLVILLLFIVFLVFSIIEL